MPYKALLVLTCCLLASGGCNIIYQQNIQQGNAIEQDKLEQLKLGMTMNQVSFLMGTPSIRDPFHQDRWDYYYSLTIRRGDPVSRLVTLRFENAVLKEMTGIDFDAQDEVVSAEPTALEDEPGKEITHTDGTEQNGVTQGQDSSGDGEEATDAGYTEVTDSSPIEPVITAIATPVAEDKDISTVAETVAQEPVEAMPAAEVPEPEQVTEARVKEAPEPLSSAWIIQLGAFDSRENADALAAQLMDAGFQVTVSSQKAADFGTRYLVRTDSSDSKAAAQQQLDLINSSLQIDGFLVPPEN